MPMIDSHTHLCNVPLPDTVEKLLKSFTNIGGVRVLNVSFDIESSIEGLKLKRKLSKIFPSLIDLAIGIHPENFIFDNNMQLRILSLEQAQKQVNELKKIVNENLHELTAIGETGLDYHSLFNPETSGQLSTAESIEIQKMSFRKHIEIALKNNLPMTIHSRDSMHEHKCIAETLAILCEEGKGKIRGSMHSYTGEVDFVGQILDLGFYIGFNAIITYKNAENVRDLVRATPLEKILLETDAPYLPLRNKGVRYGSPLDIADVAKVIAEIKGVSLEKVIAITTENYIECFERE